MKAISLWQPYATLIAIGAKQIETRSWRTSYRGLLAIAATKKSPDSMAEILREEPFFSELCRGLGECTGAQVERRLLNGCVVAVCELAWCSPIGANTRPTNTAWQLGADYWQLTENEFAFGDYSRGRWAWLLKNIRALATPIPCRGEQSLWDVPAATLAQINAQLKGH